MLFRTNYLFGGMYVVPELFGLALSNGVERTRRVTHARVGDDPFAHEVVFHDGDAEARVAIHSG